MGIGAEVEQQGLCGVCLQCGQDERECLFMLAVVKQRLRQLDRRICGAFHRTVLGLLLPFRSGAPSVRRTSLRVAP